MLSFDGATQAFSITQILDSLALSGAKSIDYTVTVNFKVFNQVETTVDKSKSFVLTIKNPCIDTNFVTIGSNMFDD